MNTYNYHPQTGELLGQAVADESPMEPGIYLLPAHATFIPAPSVSEGEVATWTGSGWNVVTKEIVIEPETEPELVTWDLIRQIRTAKLASCDWTQIPDTPLTETKRAEWVAYRQVLRDITEIFISPETVIWPDEPLQ